MSEELMDIEIEGNEDSAAWNILTPEQKEHFKKLTEKNEKNLNYIG